MNSRGKPSAHITRKQVAALIDAATFAWRSDRPLTRFLSFNLKRSDARPQAFLTAFTKLAGDWLGTHATPRAYLGIIEHPPMKSLNVHLLVHVPDALMAAFAKKERGWLIRAGVTWRKDVLRSQKVGIMPGKKKRELSDGEYLTNLERALGYILKGADPQTCDVLRIDHCSQGITYGKRVCIAEGISAASRAAANYSVPSSARGSILFRYRPLLLGRPT